MGFMGEAFGPFTEPEPEIEILLQLCSQALTMVLPFEFGIDRRE